MYCRVDINVIKGTKYSFNHSFHHSRDISYLITEKGVVWEDFPNFKMGTTPVHECFVQSLDFQAIKIKFMIRRSEMLSDWGKWLLRDINALAIDTFVESLLTYVHF